jgi:uncharacterized protein (DUF2164 family)
MKIELSQQMRDDAIASIQRYFEENMTEPIGNLPAGMLLDFFVEDIGPAIYNRAVADAQSRLALRVSDVSGELYVDEFQYWPRTEARRRSRRK